LARHTQILQHSIKTASALAALLLAAGPLFTVAQVRPPKISEDDIKRYFSQADCEGVVINHLEYFDFTGDGQDEAVVLASTCMTGTAGPDIHAVVTRLPDGSLAELKIPDPSEKQQVALFGRIFYELTVKDGLLVGTYHDESGRPNPLVIKYRWSGRDKEFQVTDVKLAPRYQTSFDCDKAKTAVENAICYSSEVASLDMAVDQYYRTRLGHLNNENSDVLKKEQKDWLRKRDLTCVNDIQIISCLEALYLYRARMFELEHFKQLHP
jgi:uncharacterized protein YecT (DUF1311 family)